MAVVHEFQRMATEDRDCWGRIARGAALAVLFCLGLTASAPAQGPAVHYDHQGVMPPGAIGGQQLQRGGPLAGFFQPVEIRAPRGALISLAEGGALAAPQPGPVRVGLLIGQVYRICVVNIPLNEGLEVFPTIEVINRLYTPRGQETRFPIVIELTAEDLRFALDGKFVTRVIYLEDPLNALPVREGPRSQGWFEVAPGTDPLAVADQLGRPVAILRMGARVPDRNQGADDNFLFGCPPLVKYPPPAERANPSQPASEKPAQPAAEKAARASRTAPDGKTVPGDSTAASQTGDSSVRLLPPQPRLGFGDTSMDAGNPQSPQRQLR
jgi:hypothetical protein